MYGYPSHMPPMPVQYGYGMPPRTGGGGYPPGMPGMPPGGMMMSGAAPVPGASYASGVLPQHVEPPTELKSDDDEEDAETAAEEEVASAEPLLGGRVRVPCQSVTYGYVNS